MPKQMLCSCHASLLSAAVASRAAFSTHTQDTGGHWSRNKDTLNQFDIISVTCAALGSHLAIRKHDLCFALNTKWFRVCGHSEVNINYLHTHTHTHVYVAHIASNLMALSGRFQFLCAGIEFQLHFGFAIAAATAIKWVQATHNV